MIRDLPKGLRGGKKFKNDRHILGWLIERLQDPGRKDLYFDRLSVYQDDLLETSTGIFRAETSYAKGIYVLSGREDADSAIPIVRSLLELWADFKYLFQSEAETDRVARVRIWGTLVMLYRLKPGQLPNPAIQSAADSLRKSDPTLFASVEKQYKKNPNGHYSGKGRKRLITEVCGEDWGQLYEFLSWEVHPITQGILDVTTHRSEGSRVRRFVYREDRQKLARFVCAPAINALSDSWSVFVKTFGSLGAPQARHKKG